jgi:hypothetical protein
MGNPLADRGRRDAFRVRGPGNIPVLAHRDEQFERQQVEPHYLLRGRTPPVQRRLRRIFFWAYERSAGAARAVKDRDARRPGANGEAVASALYNAVARAFPPSFRAIFANCRHVTMLIRNRHMLGVLSSTANA